MKNRVGGADQVDPLPLFGGAPGHQPIQKRRKIDLYRGGGPDFGKLVQSRDDRNHSLHPSLGLLVEVHQGIDHRKVPRLEFAQPHLDQLKVAGHRAEGIIDVMNDNPAQALDRLKSRFVTGCEFFLHVQVGTGIWKRTNSGRLGFPAFLSFLMNHGNGLDLGRTFGDADFASDALLGIDNMRLLAFT